MAAAEEVEPAALAYIRHLVEELEDTSFEDACADQADEFNDGDVNVKSVFPFFLRESVYLFFFRKVCIPFF